MRIPMIVPSLILGFSLVGGAASAEFQRIRNEEIFREIVVGKMLMVDDSIYREWLRITADGKMNGVFRKKRFVGAWVWKRKFLCRDGQLGKEPELNTDCQVFEIDGNKLRVTRNKGKGKQLIYTMN